MIRHVYDFKSAFIEGYNDFRILAALPPELYPEDHEPVIVEVVRSTVKNKLPIFGIRDLKRFCVKKWDLKF